MFFVIKVCYPRVTKKKYRDENGKMIDYEFIDEDGNRVENKFDFYKGAMEDCIAKINTNENLEIDTETG